MITEPSDFSAANALSVENICWMSMGPPVFGRVGNKAFRRGQSSAACFVAARAGRDPASPGAYMRRHAPVVVIGAAMCRPTLRALWATLPPATMIGGSERIARPGDWAHEPRQPEAYPP